MYTNCALHGSSTPERRAGLETNPVVIAGVLYGCTPTRKVIALDATSGKLLWKFDSGIPGRGQVRGLAYWTDGQDRRIFARVGNFLYSLNANDGKPIQGYGESGRVDLRKGLGDDYRQQSIRLTSPGIVYKDLVIVGGGEPEEHPAPPVDVAVEANCLQNLKDGQHDRPASESRTP
jgi:quinoprotein glucose dehydrogenase